MHRHETSILRTLRWTESARFSQLMRPTGLTGDDFKFYLRKLVKQNYVLKSEDGLYRLSHGGKELANNLDEQDRQVQKSPKLSVMLVIPRRRADDEIEYLFQQRLRQPFLRYWGFLSGPVRWGEAAETAASRELLKQCGLRAVWTVRAFCRARDRAVDDERLLEDKLFIVLEASEISGEVNNSWGGGFNRWMTVDELQKQSKHFSNGPAVVEMLRSGNSYLALDCQYELDQY